MSYLCDDMCACAFGHCVIAHSLLQVDRVSDPQKMRREAEKIGDIVCISAITGDGLQEFCNAVQEKLKVRGLTFSVVIFP